MYKHQKLREKAPEIEALKLGTNCSVDDLKKAFVIIESTSGDSHPGSVHLRTIAESLKKSIDSNKKLKGFNYYVTDMCDGIAQGHEGMYYSLLSRDMIANMMELHVQSSPFDAAIYLSSCDKGIPGSLMAMVRNDIPSVFLNGGIMKEGKNGMTLEQVGKYNLEYLEGNIDNNSFLEKKKESCPSCGACSFMGTAATMQVMIECLGLALPGSSLVPTHIKYFHDQYMDIDLVIESLINQNLKPSDIVTEKSIKNALVVHAAIGGSTNAFLHLLAICKELDIEFKNEWINEINEKVKCISKIRPIGKLAGEYFFYAGGVPYLMNLLSESLYLDELTITGKTHRENLKDLRENGYFDLTEIFLKRSNLNISDVFQEKSTQEYGNVLMLKGNIATGGCLIKTANFTKEMEIQRLSCLVFDSEAEAFNAVIKGNIEESTAIVVRYSGPAANGMPEMFYLTEALSNNERLSRTCALLTDGRFSGASKGPIIGHISPEAARDGTLAYIRNGDILEINLREKIINIINQNGEMTSICDLKKREIIQPNISKSGVLNLYSSQAASAMEGGYMKGNYAD